MTINKYKSIISSANNLIKDIDELESKSSSTVIFRSAIEKYIDLAQSQIEIEELYNELKSEVIS